MMFGQQTTLLFKKTMLQNLTYTILLIYYTTFVNLTHWENPFMQQNNLSTRVKVCYHLHKI